MKNISGRNLDFFNTFRPTIIDINLICLVQNDNTNGNILRHINENLFINYLIVLGRIFK